MLSEKKNNLQCIKTAVFQDPASRQPYFSNQIRWDLIFCVRLDKITFPGDYIWEGFRTEKLENLSSASSQRFLLEFSAVDLRYS